ncbi:MAG: MOSC domain-containing protein [Christensenellaceae bacterium]|nr:MOSC domain-containing protein [Christensenellaceae bacterium]
MGLLKAICISEKRGIQKTCVPAARLVADWGIEGDAHAGNWHRQVSLLSYDRVEEFRARGAEVADGAFGENLLVEGIDFRSLPVGTRLSCGDALLEITQVGKECHNRCAIYHAVGDCIMPREGVFARVLQGGDISPGDEVSVVALGKRPYRAAVITLSDRCSRGEREDTAGPAIVRRLSEAGYEIKEPLLLPDDGEQLKSHLVRLADERQVDLILTSGGTGFAPRDVTPEATLAVATRNAPGIAEAMRAHSLAITPKAMLSRGVSVIRYRTLIINLPGSPKACSECLDCVMDALPHALDLLRGGVTDCAAD